MLVAPKPLNEHQRLDALWSYELLDTEPEAAFDAVTQLAAEICGTPVGLVSLVDADRQWFKAQCGLNAGVDSTGRDVAFCAHAILQNDIFEVPDALADPRFADNPLVTGEPYVRFYAGVPLVADGLALGTLCIIDWEPRHLDARQRLNLQRLAHTVVGLIVTRVRRSEADERRLALLETSIAQSRERAEQLRALVRLSNALETARSADDVIAIALNAAVRLCPNSRGSIVVVSPDAPACLPAADPAVASALVRPAGASLVITRGASLTFSRSERGLLDLIANLASLALANRLVGV